MKIGKMKTSKYLKKEDAGNGVTVTIVRIDQQDVSMENDPADMKYVMYFQENVDGENKGMVLNWTNIQLCARACGSEETEDWIGKQIEIYSDPNVSYGGKLIGGIRIRAVGKSAGQQNTSSTPPSAETRNTTQQAQTKETSPPSINSENPAEGMEDGAPF